MSATEARVASETVLVDLWERGVARRTSGYLLLTPRPALVEPGSARSAEVWLEALARHGVARDDVAYIVVTHVHLDHGGGAGILARHLPRARVVVHPRGARHLVDPRRLVAAAREVFGERLEAYWGLPEPVPEARLEVPEDRGRLPLGGGHVLRFFDAPGHARHQYMILDEGTGSLFSGDELGVRYPTLREEPDYVLPSTAPNQFDPDAMVRSTELLRALRPERVLFGHFGLGTLPVEALARRIREQVEAFVALVADGETDWREVRRRLEAHVRRDLEAAGLAWDEEARRALEDDLEICARGLAAYAAQRAQG